MVVQEIDLITSVGCPITSYPGLLAMVAAGKLDPKRLVGQTIPVEGVNDVLNAMTEFATLGFQVINRW
jgi:D-arabinose 1-dehydrogenase-like Zn-dependent alcohol dehydrogenase